MLIDRNINSGSLLCKAGHLVKRSTKHKNYHNKYNTKHLNTILLSYKDNDINMERQWAEHPIQVLAWSGDGGPVSQYQLQGTEQVAVIIVFIITISVDCLNHLFHLIPCSSFTRNYVYFLGQLSAIAEVRGLYQCRLTKGRTTDGDFDDNKAPGVFLFFFCYIRLLVGGPMVLWFHPLCIWQPISSYLPSLAT